jgi:hypothetical protein
MPPDPIAASGKLIIALLDPPGLDVPVSLPRSSALRRLAVASGRYVLASELRAS